MESAFVHKHKKKYCFFLDAVSDFFVLFWKFQLQHFHTLTIHIQFTFLFHLNSILVKTITQRHTLNYR